MGDTEDQLQQPLLESSPKQKIKARFVGLDLMRGFIMVVMAWDHTKDSLANVAQHGQETWNGEGPNWRDNFAFLFARIVSDICAPGFFFTMGLGMTFFSVSRINRGWTEGQVIKHFLERSLALIVLDRVASLGFIASLSSRLLLGNEVHYPSVNRTLEPEDVSLLFFFAATTVSILTALGCSMLLATFLILLPSLKLYKHSKEAETNESRKKSLKFWSIFIGVAACFLCFIVSNIVVVHYQHGHPEVELNDFPGPKAPAKTFLQYFVRMFLIPGPGAAGMIFRYPLIPWAGLAFLGVGMGFLANDDFTKFIRLMGKLSPYTLIAFLIVRFFGGPFGNFRGWPRGDGTRGPYKVSALIEFFYCLKYPPSPAYALWTMGVNFGLIWLLSRDSVAQVLESEEKPEDSRITRLYRKFLKMLHTFGTVPLFFYIAHLLFIGAIGVVLGFFYVSTDGYFQLHNFVWVVMLWVLVVATMLPACEKYGIFKSKQPSNSWWRLL